VLILSPILKSTGISYQSLGLPSHQSTETLGNCFFHFSVPEYYEFGIQSTPAAANTKRSCLADNGAFVAFSGKCTG
jgi:hypothetical protein